MYYTIFKNIFREHLALPRICLNDRLLAYAHGTFLAGNGLRIFYLVLENVFVKKYIYILKLYTIKWETRRRRTSMPFFRQGPSNNLLLYVAVTSVLLKCHKN